MVAALPTNQEPVSSGLVIPESARRLSSLVHTTSTTAGVVPADLVIAAIVALASLLSLWLRTPILDDTLDGSGAHPAPELAASVQIALTCMVIGWGSRAPGTVLAAIVLITVATYVEQYPPLALPYPVLVAMYTVAGLWPRRTAVAALATTLAVMSAGFALFVASGADDDLLTESMAILAVWALGRGVRLRQVQSTLLAERGGTGASQDRSRAARHRCQQHRGHRRVGRQPPP